MGQWLNLAAADGFRLQAYRADPPEGKGKRGGLVIVQEIFGVNSHIRKVCDSYAQEGFVAIAPALFDRVQKGILNDKTLRELPPVKQRLYRDNPINGRRALYIGAHAGYIVGWPKATGEALLYELGQRADQLEFRLSHAWREGDVIVWDNRAILHRATYYDTVKYKRLMQRTTIAGDSPTVLQ